MLTIRSPRLQMFSEVTLVLLLWRALACRWTGAKQVERQLLGVVVCSMSVGRIRVQGAKNRGAKMVSKSFTMAPKTRLFAEAIVRPTAATSRRAPSCGIVFCKTCHQVGNECEG